MLGAIIGDIVGSRWEFNPTNDYNFEWLSDKNDFTDDTICTVAVADALLHGRDPRPAVTEETSVSRKNGTDIFTLTPSVSWDDHPTSCHSHIGILL